MLCVTPNMNYIFYIPNRLFQNLKVSTMSERNSCIRSNINLLKHLVAYRGYSDCLSDILVPSVTLHVLQKIHIGGNLEC